jgi:glycosyltransferase involved in cell wall biosynthesis
MTGGGEEEFERLLKYFTNLKFKYEIHALFPEGENKLKYSSYCDKWAVYQWGYIPVVNDKFTAYVRYLLKFFIQFFQILKFSRNKNYDLCIINAIVLLWPAIVLRFLGYKVVVFVREDINPIFLRHFIYKILKWCNCYFIANSNTKKKDIEISTSTTKIDCVYPAVEENNVSNISDLKGLLSDEHYDILSSKNFFKFINIGPIQERKNQNLIVEALAELKKSNCQMPYIFFVGPYNPSEKYFKKLHAKLQSSSSEKYCFFLGELPKSSLLNILKLSDSLIITSVTEGMPISLLEAFRFKKPVISTKVGGIPEIILNNVNGILIDFKKNNLAASMAKLISDTSFYNSLASEAYHTFKDKFNLKIAMHRTEEIFLKIINNKLL